MKKKKKNPSIPKVFIRIANILQSISYELATLYAIKLFITPFKFKTPERERVMAKSAQKKFITVNSIKKDICIYSYGYSKKKALLVHGWSGRGTQLVQIADKLLENGFMTISFDGPAHGESSGKTTMMNEFVETIKVINHEFGPFEIAIGHSLGGMSVLNANKQGVNFTKIISIGAGDIITDIIKDFTKKLNLKPVVIDKIKKKFYKKFNEDIDNYSASVAAKHVSIPTLIIHDTEDTDVAVECAYNIRNQLSNGKILITNGLGHRRILRDSHVISNILNFINNE